MVRETAASLARTPRQSKPADQSRKASWKWVCPEVGQTIGLCRVPGHRSKLPVPGEAFGGWRNAARMDHLGDDLIRTAIRGYKRVYGD